MIFFNLNFYFLIHENLIIEHNINYSLATKYNIYNIKFFFNLQLQLNEQKNNG